MNPLSCHILLLIISIFASGFLCSCQACASISIKKLLSKAKPGQAVRVPPGTYLDDIVIPAGVSLIGTSAHNTIIVGSIEISATPQIPVSLSRITLIHTGGGSLSAVSCNGGSVNIRHSLLMSEGGSATVTVGEETNVSLRNNIIVGPNGGYAIFGRNQAGIEVINNTLVVQGFGVGLMGQSTSTVRNCLFYGNGKPAIIRTDSDYSISYSNISLTGGSFYYNHDLVNGDIILRDPWNFPHNPTPKDLTNKDVSKYESEGLTFINQEFFRSRHINEYRKRVPQFAKHTGSPDKGDQNVDGSRNTLGAFGGPFGDRWN